MGRVANGLGAEINTPTPALEGEDARRKVGRAKERGAKDEKKSQSQNSKSIKFQIPTPNCDAALCQFSAVLGFGFIGIWDLGFWILQNYSNESSLGLLWEKSDRA